MELSIKTMDNPKEIVRENKEEFENEISKKVYGKWYMIEILNTNETTKNIVAILYLYEIFNKGLKIANSIKKEDEQNWMEFYQPDPDDQRASYEKMNIGVKNYVYAIYKKDLVQEFKYIITEEDDMRQKEKILDEVISLNKLKVEVNKFEKKLQGK